MKLKKQVRQVLEQHGIPSSAVCGTRGGHIRIKLSRCIIFTGSTPSDRRSVKNLAAQLKRGAA